MLIAVIFLPAAATVDCPIGGGWTPSPNSGTCFKVPPERSTSLFRCVELCEEHGGAPACIGSAEENALVTAGLAATEGLWLGLYQNETGLGPAKGWGRCVAGDASSFTNWHEGQPDDYHGYQQDCAWVDAGSGQWRALACDGGVRFDPLPWRIAELSCLCAHGNASAAFAHDRKALEATSGYNQRLLTRRTAISFSIAAALAVLPTLLLLGRMGWRRLRRGANAAPRLRVQGGATSPPRAAASRPLARRATIGSWALIALSSLGSSGSLSRGRQAGAASSAVKGTLRAARASAAGRRLRVSFAMLQAGWELCVIGLTPVYSDVTGQSIAAAVGDRNWWLLVAPLGGCLLLLALLPIDARAIRVLCTTLPVVGIGIAALNTVSALAGNRPAAVAFPIAAVNFLAAAVLVPTVCCCCDRATQPRPALRQLWKANRLYCLGNGVVYARFSIAAFVQVGKRVDSDQWAAAAVCASNLLCAALFTPRNRGRIHRRLARLGGRGTDAEEAAAIAALVGGSDPDATLERAQRLLRCLPASRLDAADLAASGLGVSTSATELAAKTVPARMGEVTAFLSHSWSDEKEAPGAKHALVSRWARRRQEATGDEPTLWLVRHSLPHTLTTRTR